MLETYLEGNNILFSKIKIKLNQNVIQGVPKNFRDFRKDWMVFFKLKNWLYIHVIKNRIHTLSKHKNCITTSHYWILDQISVLKIFWNKPQIDLV